MRLNYAIPFNATAVVATTNGAAVDVSQLMMADITASITDSTPGATTFTFASGNNFTDTAHGYPTGLKVQVSTSGSLPTGLTAATNYWIIAIDANTIAFASSLANAQVGTAITISGAGTGTQTVTPQALAGTIKLQKANEVFDQGLETVVSPTWLDIGSSSQNYSTSTPLNWTFGAGGTFPEIAFSQLRAVANTTSGYATITLKICAKGL